MYFYYSTLFCQKNQSSSLFFSIQVVDKISLAQLTLFWGFIPNFTVLIHSIWGKSEENVDKSLNN